MTYTLETRLARASRDGDLQTLLCALEGADWAVLLPDTAALHAVLASLLGDLTLRIDPLLPTPDAALRNAGLAVDDLEADWRGSVAWLVEPDERAIKRAARADTFVIADATLSPGGGALARGARWVTYRDAGVLSGHGDVTLTALLGRGERPELAPHLTPPVPALTETLARRDLATLGARLSRQTASAALLAERLGGRAHVLSGPVLYVEGDLPDVTPAFDPHAPLGGVIAARRDTPGGTFVSAGLEGVEDLWQSLQSGAAASTQATLAEPVTLTEAPTEAEAGQPDDQLGAQPDGSAESPVTTPEPITAPEPERPLLPDLPEHVALSADTPAELTADLTTAQLAAFERLREWRNAEARRQEVSRFIIASNATLAELARRAPQTEPELREVRGMGPERVRKYADKILNMLRGLDS